MFHRLWRTVLLSKMSHGAGGRAIEDADPPRLLGLLQQTSEEILCLRGTLVAGRSCGDFEGWLRGGAVLQRRRVTTPSSALG